MSEFFPRSPIRPELAPSESSVSARRDPAVLGMACCVFAAVTYTVVNTLLRDLGVRCNQVWVLFIKESVTVFLLGPWLLWQRRRGWPVLPGWRVLGALALAGLATQLVGNLSAIWAMSRVGLAIAVPIMSGMNLVAGATLGWICLGERVSRRSAAAIGLLITAVVLLSIGAPLANRSIAATAATVASNPASVVLAIIGTCVAGITYAALSVVIRRNVTVATRPTAVVFVITLMGMTSLGPLGLVSSGAGTLLAMAPIDVGLTMAAGAINLVAFVAVTKGLQLIPVARVNVLTASQVAMGAVVGMLVFAEPPSSWLTLGVAMTIVGMILIGRRDSVPETPETPI